MKKDSAFLKKVVNETGKYKERVREAFDEVPTLGSVVEVDGDEYIILSFYDEVPGYALCTPHAPDNNSRREVEPKLFYLPQVAEFHAKILEDPSGFLENLNDLMPDESKLF